MSEFYDELIFINPSKEFEALIKETSVYKEEYGDESAEDFNELRGVIHSKIMNGGIALKDSSEWECKLILCIYEGCLEAMMSFFGVFGEFFGFLRFLRLVGKRFVEMVLRVMIWKALI